MCFGKTTLAMPFLTIFLVFAVSSSWAMQVMGDQALDQIAARFSQKSSVQDNSEKDLQRELRDIERSLQQGLISGQDLPSANGVKRAKGADPGGGGVSIMIDDFKMYMSFQGLWYTDTDGLQGDDGASIGVSNLSGTMQINALTNP